MRQRDAWLVMPKHVSSEEFHQLCAGVVVEEHQPGLKAISLG
jgi:hypothetical protein